MDGIISEIRNGLEGHRNSVICFSGGLDSTVVLKNAVEFIPGEFAVFMADLPMMSDRQRMAAVEICRSFGAVLNIEKIPVEEMNAVLKNGHDRCYRCKSVIYRHARDYADRAGLDHLIGGENADDRESERPGTVAGREFGVFNPLKESGIGRGRVLNSIREIGLPMPMVKDTCLLTRFPIGVDVKETDLRFVEVCETEIRRIAGVKQLRVRVSDGVATVLTSSSETGSLIGHSSEIKDFLSDNGLLMKIDGNGYGNI